MAKSEWFTEYPNSETEFLEIGESDHRPLVTYFTQERYEPKRRFRYDDHMTEKDGFRDTVKRGWHGTGQMQLLQIPLVQLLRRCRQHISRWKRSNRTNTAEIISCIRGRLDKDISTGILTAQARDG